MTNAASAVAVLFATEIDASYEVYMVELSPVVHRAPDQ